jgi:intracellular sulfur oxidation DsrE/DsrF family protein
MAGYLLIASRDPFESGEIRAFYGLARSLAQASEEVTLVLVENGVLPARAGAGERWIGELRAAGVEVIADEFSLRERGIPKARLAEGVTPVSLDVVVEHLGRGRKALWQ